MVEQQQEALDTKKCDMCEKLIEVSKFRLHSVACSRNNYKCAKCGDIIPKSDKDQHEEDVHTDKPDLKCDLCPDFNTKIASQLATHKTDNCKNRQLPIAQQCLPESASLAQPGSQGQL